MGVQLRGGKFYRVVGPGMHLKIPFGFDSVLFDNVVTGGHKLGPMSLTTKDEVDIVLEPELMWKITDIKIFLLNVEGKEAIFSNCSSGFISSYVEENNWTDITVTGMVEELLPQIREYTEHYGVYIEDMVFRSKVKCSSLRVWNETQTQE